ncbi:ABC transporter permease [Kitasatospora sp. NBC_00070]|uniref:ABC transporter permease n=1 Tax=Kitasatospora sp. NBC_00070 TaxID=2975962 RepID=UPI0032459ECA
MNFFKRAWWRLTGHPGRTVLTAGLLSVICTLVLAGFLIRSAADRAGAVAKSSVGAVATLQFDLNAAIDSGKLTGGSGGAPGTIGDVGNLHSKAVDRVGSSPGVQRYNYSIDSGAGPTGTAQLYQPVPTPPGAGGPMSDFFKVTGIHDSAALSAFRNGNAKIVAGSGIGPGTDGPVVLVEQRLARKNNLQVGSKVMLKANEIGSANQGKDFEFTVVGIYADETPSGSQYVPPMADPANQIYTTPAGATTLAGYGTGPEGSVVKQATFTLDGPDRLDALKAAAAAAGIDPVLFPVTVNDKQYQALVGPIGKTARFATVTVWLVSVAGTAIVALVVAAALRDRRRELGILLAMGERKPRLLGQHLVEILACAALAVGLATAVSPLLARAVGSSLLSQQVDAAERSAEQAAQQRDPGRVANQDGYLPKLPGQAGPQPIDHLAVRLGPADVAGVAGAGLAVAVLATVVPGIRILRLNPNEILSKEA